MRYSSGFEFHFWNCRKFLSGRKGAFCYSPDGVSCALDRFLVDLPSANVFDKTLVVGKFSEEVFNHPPYGCVHTEDSQSYDPALLSGFWPISCVCITSAFSIIPVKMPTGIAKTQKMMRINGSSDEECLASMHHSSCKSRIYRQSIVFLHMPIFGKISAIAER